MATPENTLITRAEVTSITTPATGRKALVLDGATLELGDTGLRDITGLLAAGQVKSGQVLVQRIGQTVEWQFVNVVLADTAVHPWTIMNNSSGLLTPFLPVYGSQSSTVIGDNTEQARIVVPPSGNIALHHAEPVFGYSGMVTFIMERAWPTTLPGVKNGDPVGV